jgi:hypothetical protein
MLSGCLLFVFVGSMLSFAPARFSEWMRWWAKRIHFPQRSNKETPDTSARKRVPGFALLCFGSFILYKVIHSLLLDISVSTPKSIRGAVTTRCWRPNTVSNCSFPNLLRIYTFHTDRRELQRIPKRARRKAKHTREPSARKVSFRMIALAAVLAGVVALLQSFFKN